MRSRDKIQAAVDRLDAISDDPTNPPNIRMLAGAVTMWRDRLLSLLPADDQELDELLAKGSNWMLSLRSDDDRAAV